MRATAGKLRQEYPNNLFYRGDAETLRKPKPRNVLALKTLTLKKDSMILIFSAFPRLCGEKGSS